jgi:hypothetical protein
LRFWFFFACAAVGLSVLPLVVGFSWVVVGRLAFPCCVSGLLALPLCGAALTFFAAAKKVSKESGFTPQAHKRVPRAATVVVHLESVPSHTPR